MNSFCLSLYLHLSLEFSLKGVIPSFQNLFTCVLSITSIPRYSQVCNNGTYVYGVTNNLLIGLEFCSKELKLYLYYKPSHLAVVNEVTDRWKEHTTSSYKNQNNNPHLFLQENLRWSSEWSHCDFWISRTNFLLASDQLFP